eukprot:CAMPEP_0183742588 /NCGR_PEP_ID=MMETSP0737-20130205/64777_1 /TAXON_ID=385413 /ORGANISM="Thalassiosira miniscula, Strain CCMP1093" /LENGTH=1396 /DNA_ID=CAMNT_0025978175 /DNA_START=206 /DNA_END=4396 /DNA_ORIENTATION=-
MDKGINPKLALVLSCIILCKHKANSHGYLSSPRSRNLLAFQETVWWPQTENDPEPETCPHCLNLGGSRARCGLSGGIRNYDTPKNALGGKMPIKIQADYTQGQDVVLNVTLTAHHKGHFVFSACPIAPFEIPTQKCFDQNKLTFVEDLLYGGNYDPNYPERAYLAPVDDLNYAIDIGSSRGIMDYSFKMRLPPNVYGDLVLIQWYYLTANSCYHDGYLQYNWPPGWDKSTASGLCGRVSSDGIGTPEQFWNCAEVRIRQSTNEESVNPIPPPNAKPTNKPFPAEISSGISIPISLPQNSPPSTKEPTKEPTNQPIKEPINKPTSKPSPIDVSSQLTIPIGLPQSVNNKPSSAGSHGKTIVGYYASWQWYDRQKKAAPENMDFTKVQRVNFAFFQTDTQGNMWGTDSWADPNLLFGPYNWNPSPGSKQYCSWDSATKKACNSHNYEQGLIYLVHAAGAEIYPSIGGWTLSDPFPEMAASATARARFAQKCVELINEYDFDGIDIDWEYPGYEDHKGTPQDRDNFKLLLNDVRAKLDELEESTGKFYGLTAALPCGPRHMKNMDIAHVADTLSELNLMTYDFHGSWSETTGINAPMYYQGWGEDNFDLHSCVQTWISAGGNRDKINIGLPFYGRSFTSATGLNQPHSGADKAVWGIDEGTPQYFNIVAKLPSMTTVWDKTTWTPYAYFDNGGLVSFDDESAICIKVQYAIENDLGGFIIWELSGDLMEDLSTPLLDVTNKKLHDPSFDCGETGFYPDEEQTGVPVPPAKSPTIQAPTIFDRAPTHFISSHSVPSNFFSPSSSPDGSGEELHQNQNQALNDESLNEATANGQQMNNPPTTDQLVNDQSVHDKPMIEQTSLGQPQPVSDQPANNQPVTEEPELYVCGGRQGNKDLKALDLTYRYEMQRDQGDISDAIKEVKASILNGIATKLNCAAASTGKRRLRSNLFEVSEDNVMAISSTQPDMPENVPCSIPVNSDTTSCDSVVGYVTAYFKEETSSTVLASASEELLFYIRTSMASGIYESARIRRLIYIESLSASSLESDGVPPENEGGSNSWITAVVLSVLMMISIGLTLFVFARKKKVETPQAEERATHDMETNQDAPDRFTLPPSNSTEETWKKALDTEEIWKNATHDMETNQDAPDRFTLPPSNSTEETWKKALDTEEIWKNAMNTYEGKVRSSFELDKDALVSSGTGIRSSELSADRVARDLVHVDEVSCEGNEWPNSESDSSQGDGTMDANENAHEDVPHSFQNMPLDTDGNLQELDPNAVDEGFEPIGVIKMTESFKNDDMEHNQSHKIDIQSLGSFDEVKLDYSSDVNEDDNNDKKTTNATVEEDRHDPKTDSNSANVGTAQSVKESTQSGTEEGLTSGQVPSPRVESEGKPEDECQSLPSVDYDLD